MSSALSRQAGLFPFMQPTQRRKILFNAVQLRTNMSREEILSNCQEVMHGNWLGKKIVIRIDGGGLHRAVWVALLSQALGKENILGLVLPHLQLEKPEATYALGEKYCSEVKTIPITMAAADLHNELEHAGVPFQSRTDLETMITDLRHLVIDHLVRCGYKCPPEISWLGEFDQDLSHIIEQLEIPQEIIDLYTKED